MYFYHEGDTLYLKSWEYNACLIINDLEKIVTENGGRVEQSRFNKGFVVNRSITSAIQDLELKIEKITKALEFNDGHKEARKNTIAKYQEEISDLKSIKNDPVPVNHGTYTHFIIDGVYYSVEFQDNPFFDHWYVKTPVVNGERSKDAYSEKIGYMGDGFLSWDIDAETIHNKALEIFEFLRTANNCGIHREKHKRRVPNTYDGGYHYETVYEKERKEKVDF